MALMWDTPRTREQALRLVTRREHRGLGPRLEAAPSRGEALLAWSGAGQGAAALEERLRERHPQPGQGQAPDLRQALERCQRPFQLWNVPRAPREAGPFRLERLARVGGMPMPCGEEGTR